MAFATSFLTLSLMSNARASSAVWALGCRAASAPEEAALPLPVAGGKGPSGRGAPEPASLPLGDLERPCEVERALSCC